MLPAFVAAAAWCVPLWLLPSHPPRAVILREFLLFGGVGALLTALTLSPLSGVHGARAVNAMADALMIWFYLFSLMALATTRFLGQVRGGWTLPVGYTALSVLMLGFVAVGAGDLNRPRAMLLGAGLILLGLAGLAAALRGHGVARLARQAFTEDCSD